MTIIPAEPGWTLNHFNEGRLSLVEPIIAWCVYDEEDDGERTVSPVTVTRVTTYGEDTPPSTLLAAPGGRFAQDMDGMGENGTEKRWNLLDDAAKEIAEHWASAQEEPRP